MAGTASMLSIGSYGEYSDEEETEHHNSSSDGEDDHRKSNDLQAEPKDKKQLSTSTNNSNNNNNSSNNNNNTNFSGVRSAERTDRESRLGFDLAIDNISDEESSRVDLSLHLSRVSSAPPIDKEPNNTKTEEDKDTKIMKAKTRLVSYGDIEDKSESEKEDSDTDPDPEKFLVISQDKDSILKPEQASSLSRSVQNMSAEDIQLPPEPAGRCSRALQEKIANYYSNIKQDHNLSHLIQQRKDFRNPSIYEKLIEFCQINEKGTNYPPEIFDPLVWGSESLYDSLDKMQKLDMEKREKERKERTKIEFVTGTKKTPSATDGPVEKKRKTKWDAQPQGPAAVAAAATLVRQPSVTTAILNPTRGALTTTATGTKSTVIPALGNIMKTK